MKLPAKCILFNPLPGDRGVFDKPREMAIYRGSKHASETVS